MTHWQRFLWRLGFTGYAHVNNAPELLEQHAQPNQINATHLTDWLHNQLASTDDPEAEKTYRSVIDHVGQMRDRGPVDMTPSQHAPWPRKESCLSTPNNPSPGPEQHQAGASACRRQKVTE